MQHEDYVKTQWWLHQLPESDRKIVGRKRRNVQILVNQYLNEEQSDPLTTTPTKPRRILFRDEVTLEPLTSSVNAHRVPPRPKYDWFTTWSSMESFYQQMSLAMGSLTNSELAYAMCNPTKQIKFDPREDPRKQKELEDEMKEWLPTVGNHIIEAKHTFEEYYPPLKSIIRNKEKIVWGSQYKHLDVGSLRSMMEHELTELGVTRLQKMVCNSCACYFPATVLYLVKHKNGSVASCQSCWKSADTRPSKTLFQLLIVRISDKWATLVGLRVDYLYGKWNERLAPMVKNLKENVLRAGEIASLLKTSTDPEEFIEACEMIIVTTMVFYLEYLDFRRSCEALIRMKPGVTDEQLFEIFKTYFPNRANNVKTGDFL